MLKLTYTILGKNGITILKTDCKHLLTYSEKKIYQARR